MNIACVVCIWIFLTEIRSSSTDEIEAHGFTGKKVTISCYQKWAWSNRKYFCRDPCDDEDVLVSSDRSPNGRYSLKYLEKGKFTVTITNLQESDSGIYWCAVERVGADSYEKVNLRVFKEISPTTTTLHTTRALPTTTQQPETQFATSSSTSRSSTPDHTTCSPSMTGALVVFIMGSVMLVISGLMFCMLIMQKTACDITRTQQRTDTSTVVHFTVCQSSPDSWQQPLIV